MCEMHQELVELDDNEQQFEGNFFICVDCARILERINIMEKTKGIKLTSGQRLRLFDNMRKTFKEVGIIK